MNRSQVDRLGERLRSRITAEDLTLLDTYRRSFREAYDAVVGRVRMELGIEVSGRPAKSTPAIVDKLRRTSMRLTQMQDIAGCRVVVPDISAQSWVVAKLEQTFNVTVSDRRASPSHGYRAVHVIVRERGLPVEVQVRTDLQHVWAELSEKLSDTYGSELKYGGGPQEVRQVLDPYSRIIREFEEHLDVSAMDAWTGLRVAELRSNIRRTMVELTDFLRRHR